MFLFSRRAQLSNGDFRGAMAWAINQTALVNQLTDLEVGLHAQMFSPGVGTIVWTTVTDTLAQLEEANDALTANDDYLDATDRGADFIAAPLDDAVLSVLHGDFDPARETTHAAVVQAVLNSGSFARGVELGIEIAQVAERISGVPTAFGTSLTGTYGGVAWVTTFETLDILQESQEKLAMNADWLQLLDNKAMGAYSDQPAFTNQLIYRRVA